MKENYKSAQPSTISEIADNINRFLGSCSTETRLNRKQAAMFDNIVWIVGRDSK